MANEYLPKEAAPANDAVWRKSIKQIESDLEEFVSLMKKSDIYKPIPHGDGQSILREALQIADHNAYHTAEIGWLIPCRSLFVACCSESETWLMGHCKLRIPYSKLVSIASSINPRLLREHRVTIMCPALNQIGSVQNAPRPLLLLRRDRDSVQRVADLS